MSKRPTALKYAGKDGAYVRGIPARDLDADDISRLTDQQLADATANHPRTGKALYREATEKQHAKPKAETAPEPVSSPPE